MSLGVASLHRLAPRASPVFRFSLLLTSLTRADHRLATTMQKTTEESVTLTLLSQIEPHHIASLLLTRSHLLEKTSVENLTSSSSTM